MNKKIYFDIGASKMLDAGNDSQFATAELHVFSSGINRHDMVCSEDVLRKTMATIYEKPIIFMVDFWGKDFGTHDKQTVPAGFIVANSAEIRRMEDNRLGLFVVGKIWKKYSGRFIEIFKERGTKKTGISVEMELLEASERGDGLVEMLDFSYSAACVLGEDVVEASPGANINMIEFAESFQADLSIEFDFKIPASIRRMAQRGLEMRERLGRGGTGVSLSIAKLLSTKDDVNPQKIKQIEKFFERTIVNKEDRDSESDAYVAYCMYGGNDGKRWAFELCESMRERDEKIMSFFAKDSDGNVFSVENEMVKEKFMVKDDEKREEEEGKQELPKEEKKEEEGKGEEEMAAVPAEQKPEDGRPNAKMSLNAYLDVSAMLAMLEKETDGFEEVRAEFEKPVEEMSVGKVMAAMFAKMCKMSATLVEKEAKEKEFSEQLCKLESFKAQVEQERFNFEVNSVLSEVKEAMPQAEFEAVKEKAEQFSLETIDAYKNMVRARAFNFSFNGKKKAFVEIGLPFSSGEKEVTSQLWK
jgi:hypothetical protein